MILNCSLLFLRILPRFLTMVNLDHQDASTVACSILYTQNRCNRPCLVLVVAAALASLPAEKAGYRYASGKWSVREVLGHVLDCERVMGHRAFSIARADPNPLPGFEENDYAGTAGHDRAAIAALVSELVSLRQSHVLMLRHLDTEAWGRTGIANDSPVTVRALAFIMAGHVRHHFAVLAERYGISAEV